MKQKKEAFRLDLNGLRGFAVILVMFFHAFPNHRVFNGGFIGVDIFFVLSGYLITLPILNTDRFCIKTFKSFAVKRIIRILPALFLLILFLLIFGLLFYDHTEYDSLLSEIFNAGLFNTNNLYLEKSSYFSPSSYSYNLLQTWSLALETKFYLIFPVIFILSRSKSKANLVFILLFIVSFIIFLQLENLNAKFYGFVPRVWELSAGVLCAFYKPKLLASKLICMPIYSVFPYLGLTLVVFGVWEANQINSLGPLTLLPVIGTCLIIAGPQESRVSLYILKNRFLNFFGDISYSLYLWHWTLLSIVFILVGRISNIYMILILIISILISMISTFLFENPIRKDKYAKRIIFYFLALLGITYLLMITSVEDLKVSKNTIEIKRGSIEHLDFYRDLEAFSHCLPKNLYMEADRFNGKPRCYQSFSGPQDVAIIGDSHGEHIFPGLAQEFPNRNFVYYLSNRNFTLNDEKNRSIAHVISNNRDIKYVIINAYWQSNEINVKSLSQFVLKFTKSGKVVYLFSDVPDFKFPPKACKVKRSFSNLSLCSQNMSTNLKSNRNLLKETALLNDKVFFIDTLQYFCNPILNKCYMNSKDLILYRDYNHLNIQGSLYLARKLINNSNIYLD